MEKGDLRYARYILKAKFGVRNADKMSTDDVVTEIERNPILRRHKKYLDTNMGRYKLTVGSPLKTKWEAEYYAQNISHFGFVVKVVPSEYGDLWLVYAKRIKTGNKIGVICPGCQRIGTAFKSQIDKKGYVTKGMVLGCPKCGSSMKKYSPW